jgi:rRNA maturation protein Nop10
MFNIIFQLQEPFCRCGENAVILAGVRFQSGGMFRSGQGQYTVRCSRCGHDEQQSVDTCNVTYTQDSIRTK